MEQTLVDISKPPAASPDFHDGNTNEDVYTVHRTYGSVEFRVPADTPVKRQDSRWSNHPTGEPRSTFPNMEVREETILIPFCDIVEMIIARADPVELAKSLWANDEVRQEFIYCLTHQYSEGNVGDGDRRKVIAEIKEAIHSTALSALTSKISEVEHEVRERWRSNRYTHDYNAHYFSVLESIEHLHGTEARKEIERRHMARFSRPFDDDDFGIGKKHWNECRDFWRAKTLELFPGPESPEAEPDIFAAPPAVQPPPPAVETAAPTRAEASADGDDLPF